LDKIFVNNYVKEFEIGAFQSEHGCTQRVEFTVRLDLRPLAHEISDDVDEVISYEIITEAIDSELESQRFNLLETLAEKIAQRCLMESRVVKAKVKIEKLDRIPGSLGVSIVRVKDNYHNLINKNELAKEIKKCALVMFSAIQNDSAIIKSWIAEFLKSDQSIVIMFEPDKELPFETVDLSVKKQVALLSMDQNAWLFSSLDERLLLASTKAELSWGLRGKKTVLFCPSQFVNKSLSSVPNFVDGSHSLVYWFAKEMQIKNIYLVGPNLKKNTAMDQGLNIMHLNTKDWNIFK